MLLENYKQNGIEGRPVVNTSRSLPVSIGFSLLQILDFNQDKQSITLVGWISLVSMGHWFTVYTQRYQRHICLVNFEWSARNGIPIILICLGCTEWSVGRIDCRFRRRGNRSKGDDKQRTQSSSLWTQNPVLYLFRRNNYPSERLIESGSMRGTCVDREWARVGTSGHEWARVGTSGHDWARLGTSGHEWARVGTSGHEWARVGMSGHERARVGTNGHEWTWMGTGGHESDTNRHECGHEWARTSVDTSGHEWAGISYVFTVLWNPSRVIRTHSHD